MLIKDCIKKEKEKIQKKLLKRGLKPSNNKLNMCRELKTYKELKAQKSAPMYQPKPPVKPTKAAEKFLIQDCVKKGLPDLHKLAKENDVKQTKNKRKMCRGSPNPIHPRVCV